jgi:hypothetical protein
LRGGVPRYVAQATPQFDADSAVVAMYAYFSLCHRLWPTADGEVGDCGKGPFMDGN